LGILLGPTGGFLFGLLPASFLAGLAGNYRRKDEYPGRFRMLCILLGLGATLVIYLAGVPYLKVVGNLSWKVALQAGMLPFILGDLLKLAIATHLAGTLHARIAQFLG
jgi:biotin transport system substrate-specific component